jgi:hypothetical protein
VCSGPGTRALRGTPCPRRSGSCQSDDASRPSRAETFTWRCVLPTPEVVECAPHRARRSRPMPAGTHPSDDGLAHVREQGRPEVARTRTWLPWPTVRSALERLVCSVTSRAFTTIPLMAGSSKQLFAVASRTLQSPEAVLNRNTAGAATPARRVAAKNLSTVAWRSSGWISSNILRPRCSSGTKPSMCSAASFA